MADYQIAYMPYIDCESFTFGRVSFLPFYNPVTQGLFSDDVLEFLKWYFAKHVDKIGEREKIVVCGLNGQPLGPWGADEREELRNTVALLCFLSLWRIDPFFPAAADNFTIYFKNFTPADKSLATRVGGYIRTTSLVMGDDAEKLKYVEPDTTTNWNWYSSQGPWERDADILEALSRALQAAQGEDWFRRLVRSVKVFNTSFSNSEALDYFDRLLLLATSLETFFDVDTANQNKFANAIVDLIGTRNSTQYSNEINQTIRKFAIRLYEVRSRYVHGDKMKETDQCHPTHGEFYRVGVCVFGLLCKYLLMDHGFITCEDRDVSVYMDTKCGLFRLMAETAKKKYPLPSPAPQP